MLSTILSALCILTLLILTPIVWGSYYYYFFFIDVENQSTGRLSDLLKVTLVSNEAGIWTQTGFRVQVLDTKLCF